MHKNNLVHYTPEYEASKDVVKNVNYKVGKIFYLIKEIYDQVTPDNYREITIDHYEIVFLTECAMSEIRSGIVEIDKIAESSTNGWKGIYLYIIYIYFKIKAKNFFIITYIFIYVYYICIYIGTNATNDIIKLAGQFGVEFKGNMRRYRFSSFQKELLVRLWSNRPTIKNKKIGNKLLSSEIRQHFMFGNFHGVVHTYI